MFGHWANTPFALTISSLLSFTRFTASISPFAHSFYLSIYSSIRPSIQSSIYPSIHRFNDRCSCPSIHYSDYIFSLRWKSDGCLLGIVKCIWQIVGNHSFSHLSASDEAQSNSFLDVYYSSNTFHYIHSAIDSFIHPSIHPAIHLFMHPFSHSFIHPLSSSSGIKQIRKAWAKPEKKPTSKRI